MQYQQLVWVFREERIATHVALVALLFGTQIFISSPSPSYAVRPTSLNKILSAVHCCVDSQLARHVYAKRRQTKDGARSPFEVKRTVAV